jgi:nucleoside permease NupC
MKTTAIICFILSGFSGLYSILLIAGGIYVMLKPDSQIQWEVFLPRAVGMLLVPTVLLIIGLVCWKKAKQPALPPVIH